MVARGRPLLILNAANVLVAWNDTRESRRAVADALPFLRRAETVDVVEVRDNQAAQPSVASRLADLTNHLRRHGVKAPAKVHICQHDAAAAEQLLDIAEQQNADLIVPGAYGQGRCQEWVFGGFTWARSAQSTRAVLLSH